MDKESTIIQMEESIKEPGKMIKSKGMVLNRDPFPTKDSGLKVNGMEKDS